MSQQLDYSNVPIQLVGVESLSEDVKAKFISEIRIKVLKSLSDRMSSVIVKYIGDDAYSINLINSDTFHALPMGFSWNENNGVFDIFDIVNTQSHVSESALKNKYGVAISYEENQKFDDIKVEDYDIFIGCGAAGSAVGSDFARKIYGYFKDLNDPGLRPYLATIDNGLASLAMYRKFLLGKMKAFIHVSHGNPSYTLVGVNELDDEWFKTGRYTYYEAPDNDPTGLAPLIVKHGTTDIPDLSQTIVTFCSCDTAQNPLADAITNPKYANAKMFVGGLTNLGEKTGGIRSVKDASATGVYESFWKTVTDAIAKNNKKIADLHTTKAMNIAQKSGLDLAKTFKGIIDLEIEKLETTFGISKTDALGESNEHALGTIKIFTQE